MALIQVSILGVDGESTVVCSTPHATGALAFLKTHDHEGSSVQVVVTYEDHDVALAYHALEALRRKTEP